MKRGNLEILDTPGLLWPKIADAETGLKLAIVGMINPENLETEELILTFLSWLQKNYPAQLGHYYGLGAEEIAEASYPLLLAIGKRRGCLQKGGEVNLLRAAELVWNDFRLGKLGPVTLEKPTAYPVSF